MRRAVPDGIRITRLGVVYVGLTLVVGLTAGNTGNNALYMVFATLLGLLAVSGLFSHGNVRRLELAARPPAEAFANRPARLEVAVRNPSRWRPRWLLRVEAVRGSAALVPVLGRRGEARCAIDASFARRGRHPLPALRVTSPFPLGLFQKGLRYPMAGEMLVFPEIFEGADAAGFDVSRLGETPSRRRGWGHALHSLRPFRPGDDPRAIHWKQTARTGELVLLERESERAQRLLIVLDNSIGSGGDEARRQARRQAFERLVSEAATAVLEQLGRGVEVALLTRDERVEFGSGARQRWLLLERLALVEARVLDEPRLLPDDPRAPHLELSLRPEAA
jgi:uncharacterized protein (DUF58 family)